MMRYSSNGEQYDVRPITEIVGEAIAALKPGEEFTARDLALRTPYFRRHVKQIIREKARQGVLVKIRYGVYKKPQPKNFTTTLPKGLAADATWESLLHNSGQFMTFGEIARFAEQIIDRPHQDCRNAIGSALATWVKSGHVERIGPEPGKFQYKLKEECNVRPPLSRKFQRLPAPPF